eukprot:287863-Rhodomonas_salina.2
MLGKTCPESTVLAQRQPLKSYALDQQSRLLHRVAAHCTQPFNFLPCNRCRQIATASNADFAGSGGQNGEPGPSNFFIAEVNSLDLFLLGEQALQLLILFSTHGGRVELGA